MRLCDFMRQLAREMDGFEADWRANHEKPGEICGQSWRKSYPLDMDEPDWWDHFRMFVESGGESRLDREKRAVELAQKKKICCAREGSGS